MTIKKGAARAAKAFRKYLGVNFPTSQILGKVYCQYGSSMLASPKISNMGLAYVTTTTNCSCCSTSNIGLLLNGKQILFSQI